MKSKNQQNYGGIPKGPAVGSFADQGGNANFQSQPCLLSPKESTKEQEKEKKSFIVKNKQPEQTITLSLGQLYWYYLLSLFLSLLTL